VAPGIVLIGEPGVTLVADMATPIVFVVVIILWYLLPLAPVKATSIVKFEIGAPITLQITPPRISWPTMSVNKLSWFCRFMAISMGSPALIGART
jgi:hypothetical protein